MDIRSHFGKQGEEETARYLAAQGFKIVARNYRKMYGEIDLIATNKDTLIFVEVKMRQTEYFDLSNVITPSKQRKIIAVAKDFLARYEREHYGKVYQFDVALLTQENGQLKLTYIPNAFCPEER
ncbi:MAG: YraN family protein [Syntrophales bacterium LBB04]|nr:YraN family protein [Syntrophales bacterium LBB04]